MNSLLTHQECGCPPDPHMLLFFLAQTRASHGHCTSHRPAPAIRFPHAAFTGDAVLCGDGQGKQPGRFGVEDADEGRMQQACLEL